MKNSCITHPENDPLIIIRRWQVEVCDGDRVAAALLSFFEYWHNIKLEMRIKAQRANDIAQIHGDPRSQDETLYQFHSEDELIEGIMIAKRDSIRKGIKLLESKNFISIHKNPNRRYAFDKTRHFLFHPETVNALLAERSRLIDDPCRNIDLDHRNIDDGRSELQSRSSILQPPSSVNASAIPEITPEISSEINKSLSLTLSREPKPEEREREFLKPKPKAEEPAKKEVHPLDALNADEREAFEKFVRTEWQKVQGEEIISFHRFIAMKKDFDAWHERFLKSAEGRKAKQEAIAVQYDWENHPDLENLMRARYYGGVPWTQEVEAEREWRTAFFIWSRKAECFLSFARELEGL